MPMHEYVRFNEMTAGYHTLQSHSLLHLRC